ncbi:ChaN family lipoprotein [Massilia sp. H-1]|nr:ChaN family lipoprotein [Massilia sp. H-1]
MRTPLLAALLQGCCSATASAACYEELKRALPDGGVVLFGEYHGTAEAPRLFGDCVREFAAHGERPAVFLEMMASESARLDGFLAARTDEAQLLAGAQWGVEDGRSSQAMLDLLRLLRQETGAGRVRKVTAFDQADGAPAQARKHDGGQLPGRLAGQGLQPGPDRQSARAPAAGRALGCRLQAVRHAGAGKDGQAGQPGHSLSG